MVWQTIVVEKRGSAAWIILNRPQELNAISPLLIAELGDVLNTLEQDSQVGSLVITGAGRAFCAGADLKFVGTMVAAQREEATAAFLATATMLMSRLESFPKPVIAAVNGIATAGGMELVLCCDLVVATESARLGDGHANFGLLPGAGGSVRLTRKIGVTRAKYLFFTGDLASAAEMAAAGLVNRIVPDADLAGAVAHLVGQLAGKSSLGLRRMKELANAAIDLSLEEGLQFEQSVNAEHSTSFDRNEGLAAFSEGRKPLFKGR
jgi:enoyl-CoA hydratase